MAATTLLQAHSMAKAKKFIQKMDMNKGGLHKALGIPQGKTDPENRACKSRKEAGKDWSNGSSGGDARKLSQEEG